MTNSLRLADRAGILAATVCAIHCLATPLFATSLQLTGVLVSERSEIMLLSTSLFISGTTVAASCLRQGARRIVWVVFVSGATLLLCARFVAPGAWPVEQGLVAAGASLVVAAHAVNLRRCRCARNQSCAAIE